MGEAPNTMDYWHVFSALQESPAPQVPQLDTLLLTLQLSAPIARPQSKPMREQKLASVSETHEERCKLSWAVTSGSMPSLPMTSVPKNVSPLRVPETELWPLVHWTVAPVRLPERVPILMYSELLGSK